MQREHGGRVSIGVRDLLPV